MIFKNPSVYAQMPVEYTNSTDINQSYQDSLDDLSYYMTRINEEGPSIDLSRDILNSEMVVELWKNKIMNDIKQKLKDVSFQLDSILREYNYNENDEYAKAKLKEINYNLDELDLMIEEL